MLNRFERLERKHKFRNGPNFTVYVVLTEDNCYYVGMTHNLYRRFRQHQGISKGGSDFVKRHGGVARLFSSVSGFNHHDARQFESNQAKYLASVFGAERVAGGGLPTNFVAKGLTVP